MTVDVIPLVLPWRRSSGLAIFQHIQLLSEAYALVPPYRRNSVIELGKYGLQPSTQPEGLPRGIDDMFARLLARRGRGGDGRDCKPPKFIP